MQSLSFTAIDFETANREAHSACQLGIAVVQAGEIVERKSWMIRPPTAQFEFTYIHGIEWRHVAGEPRFDELWPQIRPYLENQVIAAHNVRFDLGVFFALMKLYHIADWRVHAIDSVAIARRAWPHLPNHQLQTVAAHLAIRLNHHDAASDAQACAHIIRSAEREQPGLAGRLTKGYGSGRQA